MHEISIACLYRVSGNRFPPPNSPSSLGRRLDQIPFNLAFSNRKVKINYSYRRGQELLTLFLSFFPPLFGFEKKIPLVKSGKKREKSNQKVNYFPFLLKIKKELVEPVAFGQSRFSFLV